MLVAIELNFFYCLFKFYDYCFLCLKENRNRGQNFSLVFLFFCIFLLKETQTFKAYWTESYKHCIIIAVSHTNCYLFKPCLCLLRFVLPSAFSTADFFQFLDTVLRKTLNVTSDHPYRCIKTRVYNNFNLRYFVS